MKAASAKKKGKKLEQEVAAAYRHYDIDESARPMPASGAFTHFKGDIWKRDDFEYLDECKQHERIRIWEFWEQAKEQTANSARKPVLHISSNRRPVLTVMAMEDYMSLRKEVKDLEKIIEELKSEAPVADPLRTVDTGRGSPRD